jgi:hypothetical protein
MGPIRGSPYPIDTLGGAFRVDAFLLQVTYTGISITATLDISPLRVTGRPVFEYSLLTTGVFAVELKRPADPFV